MTTLMIGKYNKYWDRYEDMNSTLFFARILDPREKEGGLEFVLQCLYENNEYRVESIMKKVKEDLMRLFEEYKSMFSTM